MDQEIQIFDWARIFIGDKPPIFLIEVVFRTTLIYFYALVLLRWLGSRTIGQLSTVELLLVIALGSAVGDAMFYPDVPLLHALLVITLIIGANKGLDLLIARSTRMEKVIDGVPEEAIRDGVICQAFINSSTLSMNELFQQLREQGVEHLGEVAHAFVETDGVLTVFRAKPGKLGLPIMPPWEIRPPVEVHPEKDAHFFVTAVCKKCGALSNPRSTQCSQCNHDIWVAARST